MPVDIRKKKDERKILLNYELLKDERCHKSLFYYQKDKLYSFSLTVKRAVIAVLGP